MSAKSIPSYECRECGHLASKWEGRCPACESWNSFIEATSIDSGSPAGRPLTPVKLKAAGSASPKRLNSGIKKLDELLGGGIVRGSVLLLAGEPGIGKSTLLMQLAGQVASAKTKVLYVSAEESVSQVGDRARRLGLVSSQAVDLLDSISAEDIAATIAGGGYTLAIIDSVQTLRSERSNSAAGNAAQVNLVGQILTRAAKQSSTAVVLVGHVTKQGTIAGPKVLEHLVDVVLNLEGDRYSTLRLLRNRKNRYGPTDELLLLEMGAKGLIVVDSPSKELLKERQLSDGSVVLAALDGNQPLLVEVQALVTPTSFGYPKRTAVGFDLNRLNLLVAMLERRTKLSLTSQDIYLNIVGGFRLQDPGADLAVIMAIASAARGMQLKDDAAVFGEVGLSGELRHVVGADKRVKEAASIGFKRVIGPASVAVKHPVFVGVKTVRDTLNSVLAKS